MIKRAIRGISVGITVIIITGVLYLLILYHLKLPHRYIKQLAEQELSKTMGQKVTIESVEGNLIYEAKLNHVRFYNHPNFRPGVVFEIGQLKAHYNLLTAAKKRNDILAATSLAQCFNVRLNMIRNSKGEWNVFYLLPPPPTQFPPPPITFKGKLIINNMDIDFTDDRGWDKSPLKTPFHSEFVGFKGALNFAKPEAVALDLKGSIVDTKSPIRFQGTLNLYAGLFDIKFNVQKLDPGKWGDYVVPLPEFKLSQDQYAIQGRIKSKDPYPENEVPFWYELEFGFKDTQFKTPFFQAPLTALKGKIKIRHGRLTHALILKQIQCLASQNEAQKITHMIWQYLIDQKIIDETGWLNVRYSAQTKPIPLKLKPNLIPYKTLLTGILEHPDTSLIIEKSQGKINQIPFECVGELSLNKTWLDLDIHAKPFNLNQMEKLFPVLAQWQLKNTAESTLHIQGQFSKPKITGQLTASEPEIYKQKPRDVTLKYSYFDKKLDIEVERGKIFKGDIRVKSQINLQYEPVIFSCQVKINNADIQSFISKKNNLGSGKFTLKADLSGSSQRYNMAIDTQISGWRVINQNIEHITLDSNIEKNKDLIIEKGAIYLNRSPSALLFKGQMRSWQSIQLEIDGAQIPICDYYDANKIAGTISISGTAQTSSFNAWLQDPMHHMQAQIKAATDENQFFGRPFEYTAIDLIFKQGKTEIKNFIAKTKSEQVSLTGKLNENNIQELNAVFNQFNLGNLGCFDRYVSDELRPLSGLISGSIELSRLTIPNPNPKLHNFPWLSQYQIKTNMALAQACIQGQPLSMATLSGLWDGKKFKVTDCHVNQNESKIALSGQISPEEGFDFDIKEGTKLYLQDFSVFTVDIGNMAGALMLNGNISGFWPQLNFDVSISADKIQSNFVRLDSITGRFVNKNRKLMAENVIIKHLEDEYALNGFVNYKLWDQTKNPDYKSSEFEIKMDIKSGDLSTIAGIIDAIYKEIQFKQLKGVNLNSEQITNANITIIKKSAPQIKDDNYKKETTVLFDKNNKNNAIQFYENIVEQQRQAQLPEMGIKQMVKGHVKGDLYVKSRKDQSPLIQTQLWFEQAEWAFIKTNKLFIEMIPQGADMRVNTYLEEGTIAEKPFQRIEVQAILNEEGKFKLISNEIRTKRNIFKNVFSGQVPLGMLWDKSHNQDPIKLKADLKGDSLSLLGYVVPYIDDFTNQGEVVINILGTPINPIIEAEKIRLKNATVTLVNGMLIESPIHIVYSQLSLKNNQLKVAGLKVQWKGSDTKKRHSEDEVRNTLELKGDLSFSELNILDPQKLIIDMDLTCNDTDLTLNFPNLYRGELRIKNGHVYGQTTVPLSQKERDAYLARLGTEKETGPIIEAELNVKDGEIVMPTLEKKVPKPAFRLNMSCQIKQNMSLGGSIFGSGMLMSVANMFDLSLQETIEPLRISGTLNAPRIKNTIIVSDGDVNLFNRNFELLARDKQQTFYAQDQSRIKDNTLSFTTEAVERSNKQRLMPIIDIKAISIIEPMIAQATQNIVEKEKYTYVVILLKGPIYNLNTITVEAYEGTDPTGKGTPELKGIYPLSNTAVGGGNENARNTYEIVKLLMPEILTEDENNRNAQRTFIGEAQLNALIRRNLLRPFERRMAQSIGLYDLRVDYNVGNALLRKTSDITGYQTTGPARDILGLNMISNILSDRLFLRVKTNIDMSTEKRGSATDTLSIAEGELTWYIWNNLSMNYAQIQDETKNNQYKSRFSLKMSYDF